MTPPVTDASKCGSCSGFVKTSEKAVTCDLCGLWHHSRCQGISEPTYKAIQDDKNRQLRWFCKPCNATSITFDRRISALEDQVKTLAAELKALKSTPHSAGNTSSVTYAKALSNGLPVTNSATVLDSIRAEETARKKRATNLCIRGLKPNPKKPADLLATIQTLANDLGEPIVNEREITVTQVGQTREDGSQAVIVTFSSIESRRALLRKAKDLRKFDQWTNVFIGPDLTPAEREIQFHLRAQLREKREKDKDNTWIIQGSRIVKKMESESNKNEFREKANA